MLPRVSSTPGRSRSSRPPPPQELAKRVTKRRKRDAEKALTKARECLKILLKAKYPTRRAVHVGDTNSDTALISKCVIYEAPPRRRRGTGENCMPLLRSPLSCCPVTTPETVVMQTSWVLFESPSFDALENSAEEPAGLTCPFDEMDTTTPLMTNEELSEGLSKWWAQLEQCWELASKSLEPMETNPSTDPNLMDHSELAFLLDQHMNESELPLLDPHININSISELPQNTTTQTVFPLLDQDMINAEFPLLLELFQS